MLLFLLQCIHSAIPFTGRYDLKSAMFYRNSCNSFVEATIEDYLAAQFWPAAASDATYFFDFDVLQLWQHLRNQCPGTSLRKFIESLEGISESAGRVSNFVLLYSVFVIITIFFCPVEYHKPDFVREG